MSQIPNWMIWPLKKEDLGFGAKPQKLPEVQMPPSLPDDTTIKDEEKKKLPKARRTILTGPQGLLQPAEIKRKVLLGD